jgi:hypothetical protein
MAHGLFNVSGNDVYLVSKEMAPTLPDHNPKGVQTDLMCGRKLAGTQPPMATAEEE